MPGPYNFPDDRVTGGPAPASDHNALAAALNEATHEPTANVLALRDADGRMKATPPAEADDVATKDYVDGTLSSGGGSNYFWISTGAPNASLGEVNDHYLDKATGIIYVKYAEDSWGVDTTLLADAIKKTIADAKGDLIVGTGPDAVTRLPIGANGTVPVADSTQATGIRWDTVGGGGTDPNAVPKGVLDAKGDLIAASAADTPARVPVGANGTVLTADSAEAAGMKWAAPAAGGGGSEAALPIPAITSGSSVWWAGPAQSGNRTLFVGTVELRPFLVAHPIRITAFRINVSTAAAGTCSVGLYSSGADGTTPAGGTLLATLLAAADCSSTGSKQTLGLTIDLEPGLYWLGYLGLGTGATLSGAVGDPFNAQLFPHRDGSQGRAGGFNGPSSQSSLPTTMTLPDTWDSNSSPYWFGVQTALQP